MPILERLTDPVRRSEYAHLLADLAGVTESSVVQTLDAHAQGRPAEVVDASPKRMSARDKVEREMLKLLARDPAALDEYGDKLTEEHFHSARRTARRSRRCGRAGGDVASIAGGDDQELGGVRSSSLAVEPLDGDGSQEYAESVWARLQEFVLKTESDALRMELQKLNPMTDPELRRPVPRARRRSTASCGACGCSTRSAV